MSVIILNPAAVRTSATQVAIPLVRKTVRQVENGAQVLAPVGDHRSGSGKPKPGPPLKASITSNITLTANDVIGTVGSKNDYAASKHQGSKPHIIRSSKGKKLTFQWDRGSYLAGRGGRKGRLYFRFDAVRHPGDKRPVRYLTTPLALYGRINGFRVTTSPVNRSFLP